MEGGKSANYWPGFVDALTNVVIAMVFVIVVLAIALSFAAQMMAKKVAERLLAAERNKPAATAVAQEESPAPPPRMVPLVLAVPAPASAAGTRAGKAAVAGDGADIVVRFDPLAFEPDEASARRLGELLGRQLATGRPHITLVGTGPDMAFSEAQRAMMSRLMATRELVLKAGADPASLTLRIDVKSRTSQPQVSIVFGDAP